MAANLYRVFARRAVNKGNGSWKTEWVLIAQTQTLNDLCDELNCRLKRNYFRTKDFKKKNVMNIQINGKVRTW